MYFVCMAISQIHEAKQNLWSILWLQSAMYILVQVLLLLIHVALFIIIVWVCACAIVNTLSNKITMFLSILHQSMPNPPGNCLDSNCPCIYALNHLSQYIYNPFATNSNFPLYLQQFNLLSVHGSRFNDACLTQSISFLAYPILSSQVLKYIFRLDNRFHSFE